MFTWFIVMDPFLPSYNFPLSQLEESQAGDIVPSSVSILVVCYILYFFGDHFSYFFSSCKECFLFVKSFI